MKYAALRILVIGMAAAACGGDDSSDDGESSRGREPEGKTNALCKVPTGTYDGSLEVSGVRGEACSLDEDSFAHDYELDGTLHSFVASGCKGTARWKPGNECVVQIEESCDDAVAKSELKVSTDGTKLMGTFAFEAGPCIARGTLSGERVTPNDAENDTEITRSDEDPKPNAGRFDVQLRHTITVPDVPWAAPERLRLHADGSFEYCLTHAVVAPNGGGLRRGTPKSSRGTYEFQKPKLILVHADGTRESKTFAYAPQENKAVVNGELWYGEALSDGPLRCDDFDA